jgi:hypothetical protein
MRSKIKSFLILVFTITLSYSSSLFCEEHCLVFVHIGKQFPKHLIYAIEQAQLFNPETPVFLLGNKEAFTEKKLNNLNINEITIESLNISKNHITYNINAKSSGFWRYTLERFLVLDDFIQQYKMFNVFHIENDVMIYFDLKDSLPIFQKCYPNMMATVFDCDQRSVPSFVYIANPETSENLSKFIAKRAHLDTTDMETLSLFKDAFYGSKGHLPILIPSYANDYPMTNIFKNTAKDPKPFYNHLDDLKMIFDAAALGQFLGGIDPILGESKIGFMGEASVFLPMHFRFTWIKDIKSRWIPHIAYKNKQYPIANLHIHSKDLGQFSSANNEMPDVPTHFFSSLPFDHIQPKEQ